MSSLGATVAALRHERRITQTELARKSGVGVAYLSRLERNHITPSMRTLQRLADAFEVPVASLFAGGRHDEPAERCPVSASGHCVLDARFGSRGRAAAVPGERYSPAHLRAMQLCDFVMHEGDAASREALVTVLEALVASGRRESA